MQAALNPFANNVSPITVPGQSGINPFLSAAAEEDNGAEDYNPFAVQVKWIPHVYMTMFIFFSFL